MRLLLDTHVFLWWLADDPRLDADRRRSIADPDALVHVSAVTMWEISIKEALGRIDVGDDFAGEIDRGGFIELADLGRPCASPRAGCRLTTATPSIACSWHRRARRA